MADRPFAGSMNIKDRNIVELIRDRGRGKVKWELLVASGTNDS